MNKNGPTNKLTQVIDAIALIILTIIARTYNCNRRQTCYVMRDQVRPMCTIHRKVYTLQWIKIDKTKRKQKTTEKKMYLNWHPKWIKKNVCKPRAIFMSFTRFMKRKKGLCGGRRFGGTESVRACVRSINNFSSYAKCSLHAFASPKMQ